MYNVRDYSLSIVNVCSPAASAYSFPFHTKTPVVSIGSRMFALSAPFLSNTYSTEMLPAGCGIVPETFFSFPGDGAIRIFRKPGALLSIPSKIR